MAGHEDRRPAPPDDFPLYPCPTTEAVVWRVHDDEALFWANVNIAPTRAGTKTVWPYRDSTLDGRVWHRRQVCYERGCGGVLLRRNVALLSTCRIDSEVARPL